jgi:hypothetical protein
MEQIGKVAPQERMDAFQVDVWKMLMDRSKSVAGEER